LVQPLQCVKNQRYNPDAPQACRDASCLTCLENGAQLRPRVPIHRTDALWTLRKSWPAPRYLWPLAAYYDARSGISTLQVSDPILKNTMTPHPTMNEMDASCRVALAAYLHDLGKFAERARLDVPKDMLDAHKTQYCPWHSTATGGQGGYHSHVHAAYTAMAFDHIERHAPNLIHGAMAPFINRTQLQAGSGPAGDPRTTDSLVNAAAAHHRPETFLQWIIATADRLASGFEREAFEKYNAAKEGNENTSTGRNHYQARLLSLLEQVQLDGQAQSPTLKTLKWRYPLKALSPQAIFPQPRESCEPGQDGPAQQEYAQLWQQFLEALQAIPATHRGQWPLWLDHFDTAWLTFTHAIPSATAFGSKPEVSLYDHSKTTAALAVALWRWHEAEGQTDAAAAQRLKERRDWDEQKFLLIQGDFFGIQDFIFADGGQTRRDAARLLRGRSFQVSLFTELAALKVLDALQLPPTSQITNGAGKFLIVAPNTAQARKQLAAVRQELNDWFLQHSFGLAGLGLASKAASGNDFLDKQPSHRFQALMNELFADLERAKLHRFDLTASSAPAVFAIHYPYGVCRYNDRLPADKEDAGQASAALSRDQIAIGKGLSRQDRLLVLRDRTAIAVGSSVTQLEVPIFGYTVAFTADEDQSGKFGNLAANASLARCWDFSLPTSLDEMLWHGYARRYINAYVPRFTSLDLQTQAKYLGIEGSVDVDDVQQGAGKTFNHIACEDRQPKREDTSNASNWQGQVALMTLKGDVDNLGMLFQQGLQAPTFAKMATLSRQLNAFFAVYLPALCTKEFPNTYTVFAGGDDFFLIGPWHSTQKLAARMAEAFRTYVAGNPGITFSAGLCMTKPGLPMQTLVAQAEDALEEAKGSNHTDPAQRKNALVVYGERVRWSEWKAIESLQQQLEDVRADYDLSTSYIYGLLHLIDLKQDTKNPEHPMWRSRFAYRTRRYVVDKLKHADPQMQTQLRHQAQTRLAQVLGEQGLEQLGSKFRIPLFNHFYRQR
jgi:CRISPR-associated protein Csm1